jgi:hypothetical protein
MKASVKTRAPSRAAASSPHQATAPRALPPPAPAGKADENSAGLRRRQLDAERRLEALRRERGAAHLAGTGFDAGAIAALEAERDGLADAASEALRREREAAVTAALSKRRALFVRIEAAEAARLGAVERAEAAARAMVAALGEAMGEGQRIRALAAELGRPAPQAAGTTDNLLSERLANLMGTLGNAFRFGTHLRFRPAPVAAAPWREGLAAAAEELDRLRRFAAGPSTTKPDDAPRQR